MIGPYTLVEPLGEGGMGVVYAAEQAHPVRRRVAVKLVKPGMDTKEVLARFEQERQALALMDHPGIATIHDAGTTPAGRPYFVMELVRGVAVTDYCDDRRLPVRDRLALFAQVCRAVQHAHQKGVIHRDLKPSNVLVAEADGRPVPKVIDFGVAKATGERLTDRTLATGTYRLVGTPLYMSPEQAEPGGAGVDTRSDVYSLGVLLYELLTGTTPFDREDGAERAAREDGPPRPSRRLATLAADRLSTVAGRRGADGRRLGRLLAGELDWVVLKCLERDRDRRYEGVGALAADVERYLADEPVEACPPSAAYRLRKLWRRNRRVLLPAGVVALALVGATAVSSWQAVEALDAKRQAQAAERRATTEAAIATAVNDFLQGDLLGQAASAPQSGQEVGENPYLTVKEALGRAAARVGQRFQGQPLVEAAIRTTIGAAYHRLYEFELAIPHLERAIELREAHRGPDHPDTLESKQYLAMAYTERGRHQEAIVLCQVIVESREARLGPDHPETLASSASLADAYMKAGQWDTSVGMLGRLLEKHRADGPTHPNTLGAMHLLAVCYAQMGRLTDSIALHETLLERGKSTSGWDFHRALLTFAVTCQRAGNFDRADPLFQEALDHCRRQADSYQARLFPTDPLGFLAQNLFLQQRYDEAEPIIREALSIFEKHLPEDPKRFYWMNLLGGVLCGQERFSEAEPLLLRGYEGMKERQALMNANWRTRLPQAGERVVRFYEVTNQTGKVKEWREKLAAPPPKQRSP